MDVISHGLWAGLVFGRKRGFWWAALFGMFPDVLAFSPYLAVRAVQGGILNIFGKPSSYPQWVYELYNYTHSLVIAGLIFAVLWSIRRDLGVLFLAWPLHILFDIPTHSSDCFPTKFLYPLSHLHLDGVHWRNLYIFLGNWLAIALAYSVYGLYKKKTTGSPGYQKT